MLRFQLQLPGYCSLDQLPDRLEGCALALCSDVFIVNRIAHRARDKGLRIIWSGEMMWLEVLGEGESMGPPAHDAHVRSGNQVNGCEASRTNI